MKHDSLIQENIRNWYFVDSVLLNDKDYHVFLESDNLKKYQTMKKKMLSSLFEFYTYIRLPSTVKFLNENQIIENGVDLARRSKKYASDKLFESRSDIVDNVNKFLTENANSISQPREIINNTVDRMFFVTTLNYGLYESVLDRCFDSGRRDEIVAQTLFESYENNRNDMIDFTMKYLRETYSLTEGPRLAAIGGAIKRGAQAVGNSVKSGARNFNNRSTFGKGKIILGSLLGFKIVSSAVNAINNFFEKCSSRCGILRLNTDGKRVCVLKCKIQMYQRIIASLRQSAAQTNNASSRIKFARDVRRAQAKMTNLQREMAQLVAKKPKLTDIEAPKTGASIV